MRRQQGIALVQVLIISMVLISLGIFISQAVRSQVATAAIMSKAFQLRLKLETTEARLLQTLLTKQHKGDSNSNNEFVKQWNFYGEPYQIEPGVTISIQDLTSLLSLNITDNILTKSLLNVLGVAEQESAMFLDSLADWKDKDELKRINGAEETYYKLKGMKGPRNGFLQSLSEVEYIKMGEILTFEQWSVYFHTELVSGFNPLNAPENILMALIKDDNIVREVIDLRAKNLLSELNFYQLTGVDADEFISFATGRRLLITITVKESNQQVVKSFVAAFKPKSHVHPVIITDVTWNIL